MLLPCDHDYSYPNLLSPLFDKILYEWSTALLAIQFGKLRWVVAEVPYGTNHMQIVPGGPQWLDAGMVDKRCSIMFLGHCRCEYQLCEWLAGADRPAVEQIENSFHRARVILYILSRDQQVSILHVIDGMGNYIPWYTVSCIY